MDLGATVSDQGIPRPRLIGVGNASVFSGFCEKHDDELFADIEKSPIIASQRHACLLGYRVLCRELYAKEGVSLLDHHLSTMDRGFSIPAQLLFQREKSAFTAGSLAGLDDLRRRKHHYDLALENEDYSTIRYCVIWFESPPDIMCAAGKNPDRDFVGNQLQDLRDLNTPAQGISLSLLASGGRGCAYFSWLAHEKDACEKFVRSLLQGPRESISNSVARYVLTCFENQFWRPAWWEGLDEKTQIFLIERFATQMNPFVKASPTYLCDDGQRLVDWPATLIETNVARLMDSVEVTKAADQ